MTNNRLLNVFLTILQLFMQMCVAVPVVNVLLHGFMGYEKFQVFNTLYIGIVVAVYYFAKTCIKKGKLSYLVHLAGAFSACFVCQGTSEEKALIVIPALAFMYYSLHRTDEKPFPALDMGIIVAGYITGSAIKAESGMVIPLYCCIMYVIAFFVWYNINNLNEFVLENGQAKSFNAEQAVNVNSLMLTIFMVICGVVMFVAPRLHLQELINGALLRLWQILLAGFHALNIQMPTGGYELEQSLKNKADKEELSDYGMLFEMSEGNDVLDMIVVIFALVIIVGMLIMLFRALKNIQYKSVQGLDVKEFVKPEFRKTDGKVEKEKSFAFWNMPNEAAVRKFYKKTIEKSLKKGQRVDTNDTPSEITGNVLGWDDSTRQITEIYEKARYGKEQISGDDVAVMKSKYTKR